MGRRRRPYLPGAVFHITARTIRRKRWFVPPLRVAALRVLAETLPRSGARLLAAAIMPNHLHVVVQQGDRPLSRLMQPLLRQLALHVHEGHCVEGPVFWRPYSSQPCLDPSYARNAIVYTHLNPVRAGLCDDPSDYPWSTHPLFARASLAPQPSELAPFRDVFDPHIPLSLFAARPDRSDESLRADYRAFVEWRLRLDDLPEGEEAGEVGGPPSSWGALLSPLFHSPAGLGSGGGVRSAEPVGLERTFEQKPPTRFAPDMTTLAAAALQAERPGVTLQSIRGRHGGRERSRLRHLVIRRLHAAGYRNIQIARFLDLSESAIWYALRSAAPAERRNVGS